MSQISSTRAGGPYCGECGVPVCEHVLGIDLLRDKGALRAALRGLSNAELGVVLGLAMARLGELGQSSLSDLMGVLARQVEAVEREERPMIVPYERADGRTSCFVCGRFYRDHLTERYGDLVLRRLCDGSAVKL